MLGDVNVTQATWITSRRSIVFMIGVLPISESLLWPGSEGSADLKRLQVEVFVARPV